MTTAASPSGTHAVALRCEASSTVGLGHAVRLLSLARFLPNACLVVGPEARDRLSALNRTLPPLRLIDPEMPAGDWIASAQMQDVQHVVLDTLFSGNAEHVAREVAAIKRHDRQVTVIDSMPPDHFMPLPDGLPDVLVTPYVGADALRPGIKGIRWLHGPRYAILAPEFLAARESETDAPLPRRILVSCGGSDPSGLSARVLAALEGTDIPVDVVVGPMFSEGLQAQLARQAKTMPTVTLHRLTGGLAPLLRSAGLLVGRPGLTRYEAACLGRHALYLVEGAAYADYFRAFADAGLAEIFFAERPGGAAEFLKQVARRGKGLTQPPSLAVDWTRNDTAHRCVDGRGAARVAETIKAQQQAEQP